jgi:hypothetical protein
VLPSAAPGHGHAHGHDDHGHDHPHEDDHVHGPSVRAAKDEPGRHDEAYYGSPGSSRKPPPVGKSQGERSFNARGARRRPV